MPRSYRIPIKSRCTLSCGTKHFPVTLENISSEGALVTLLDGSRFELEGNDEACSLILGSDPAPSTFKSLCKIVRLDANHKNEIGIQFLEPLEDYGKPEDTTPPQHEG